MKQNKTEGLDQGSPRSIGGVRVGAGSLMAVGVSFVSSPGRPEDQVLDVLLDEIDGHGVLGPSGDDHVGVLLGRNTELLKCWFD